MENSNYPQTYPAFEYFPPPSAWIDPNSVSSDDNNTPTWVIVGVVIVVVMLCGFLFYYIQRREKKIREKAASKTIKPPPPTTPEEKKDPPPTKKKPDATPKNPATPANPPPMGIPISYPGHCPACGHGGGLHTFSYTCPLCKHKIECNVAYPPKK
ncbi:hypothetical protein ACJRO7_011786 [Eucalyptus globulus]|uniref:Uncharacterized protein n=1 Tax=Eucalyptus globulus TaxID=34317 RepID=A0ABD3LGC6_EUCGL